MNSFLYEFVNGSIHGNPPLPQGMGTLVEELVEELVDEKCW
jgi:hypothetical protein